MTEAEWTSTTNPRPMLKHVRQTIRVGWAKGRKSYLLAVACARLVWPRITDERMRRVIRWAEVFADDNQNPDDWTEMVSAAQHAYRDVYEATGGGRDQPLTGDFAIALAVRRLVQMLPIFASGDFLVASQDADGRNPAGADIIRDIFGNPFHPVSFATSWRTSTVVALARQMYESRDFSAMPILADALLDAGCDNRDMMDHCRDPKQVHVRGCCLVDSIFAQE